VTSISEITGMEQDVIAMQEIFQFQQSGINEAGRVVGSFRATGVRPKCADRIVATGRQLPMDMFSHVHPVNQARHERRL
jgi:pilus assembly protein CpaF